MLPVTPSSFSLQPWSNWTKLDQTYCLATEVGNLSLAREGQP